LSTAAAGSRTRYARSRSPNIFDLLLAQVFEGVIELVAHLIADNAADADPARLGQSL